MAKNPKNPQMNTIVGVHIRRSCLYAKFIFWGKYPVLHSEFRCVGCRDITYFFQTAHSWCWKLSTYWGRDEIAAMLQTFSFVFS